MAPDRLLVLGATTALVAGLSQAQVISSRPSGETALLCVAGPKSTGGTVKAIRVSAVSRYLDKGACRLAGPAPTGSACSTSDPDGDDVCGSDGATCGDGHGPGGIDNPCLCGETVVTNTTLDAGFDPAVGSACPGDGLSVGDGVRLDLNGNILAGSDTGTGLIVPGSAEVRGGAVQGFATGVHVASASAVSVLLTGVALRGNAGDGALIDVTDAQGRVVLDTLTIEDNAGEGLRVRAAPGAANLDDVHGLIAQADYGVVLQGNATPTVVRNNLGNGIHVGDPAQVADVSVMIGGPQAALEVSGNGGIGVVLEQKAGLAPGADCGSSASWPGCSGMTLVNSRIHDNAGSGVELRSGFVVPLDAAGLGFLQNLVFHNAMAAPGCVAAQSAPQIGITGPVGLDPAPCAALATEPDCATAGSSPGNQHCVWTGSQCQVAWDLRGALTTAACANGNKIFGYSTGASPESVGMRATGFSAVDARNNQWVSSPKTSVGGGSYILADPSCGAIGCLQ
jgi:hypothetical protein